MESKELGDFLNKEESVRFDEVNTLMRYAKNMEIFEKYKQEATELLEVALERAYHFYSLKEENPNDIIKKRIIDLLSEEEKKLYNELKRELMSCVSDKEREMVNNKISILLQKVIVKQLSRRKVDE